MKITRYLSVLLCLALVVSCSKDSSESETKPAPGPDRELSGNCDLVDFEIPQGRNSLAEPIVLTFDREARTITGTYLKWIDSEEPDMLIPNFKITGKDLRVEGKEIISGRTPISFSEKVTLVVYAENGNRKEYTVDLNIPQINTELPVLHIRPDKPIVSKTEYVNAYVDLYRWGSEEGKWTSKDGKIQIRGRGNSTWILPKKPYRLKFPVKFSPVGLNHATEKSWVILAHDMDKSLIRNHIAFAMSRVLFNPDEKYHDPAAVLFTPCSQYVNVYMGDDYHGLYQMSDQMERGDGRINVQKLTAADGSDPNKIAGGHILEVSVHGETYPVRFKTKLKGIQVDHKYPDDDDFHQTQYNWMEDYLNKAEAALYSNDFKDPVNGWRKYFDEKTLADYVIVKELAADMDGYCSTYLYKKRNSDKIFFGPVWDVDKGWDNEKRGASDYLSHLMIHSGFGMPGSDSNHWYVRLWQDETFRATVNARWKAKKSQLVQAIYNELEHQPELMRKAIEANFSVWDFHEQASTEAKKPADSYEQEIYRIRTLTNNRVALLDRLFAQ